MFESKREGPPVTSLVLEVLAAAEYGEVVPYDAISEVADGVDRRGVQSLVGRVKRRLEREHSKAVEAVANEGYRVVNPSEHLRLARGHQSKSRKSLARAQSTVLHVDASKLTDGEKVAVTVAATALAAQLTYMRQNDIRVGRLEKAAEVIGTAQERSAEEIAALRDRLDKLENR